MPKRPAGTRKPPRDLARAIDFYEQLDPSVKAWVRKEIMKRAAKDEMDRHAREVAEERSKRLLDQGKVPMDDAYEPFSEQIIGFLRDSWTALSRVLPTDSYRPGDEDRRDLFRRDLRNALEPLEWLLKSYFRYEVHGIENIPREGRAMIVSNHGLLPLDGWFLNYEILRTTGRWPRGLTDWRVYRLPYLRQFFMDMGMVVGSHGNGDSLLQDEELIFIMPGGARETWKSSRYRYRLVWKDRKGFIRLALRNRCPIIPSANVGTDDTYHVFFNGYTTAKRVFRTRRPLLPVSLPVGIGVLPFPVKMTQYVGVPIRLPYPPEAEGDPAIVDECQELVKARVYELIDQGLHERAHGT